jgi:hypothetical protein
MLTRDVVGQQVAAHLREATSFHVERLICNDCGRTSNGEGTAA